MQTFYFTSLAALLSFTTAYNIASGSSPSGNDISAPAPGAQIPAGKSFTIRWSPSAPTTNDLSLILVEGSSSNPSSMQSKFTIADNVPNTGSYTWNVDGSVTPATDYAVLLVVGGTQSYQLSSNFAVGPVGSTASGGNSNSNSGSSSPSGMQTSSSSSFSVAAAAT